MTGLLITIPTTTTIIWTFVQTMHGWIVDRRIWTRNRPFQMAYPSWLCLIELTVIRLIIFGGGCLLFSGLIWAIIFGHDGLTR